MTQVTVALDELKLSASNVRPKHDKADINMMARALAFAASSIHPQ